MRRTAIAALLALVAAALIAPARAGAAPSQAGSSGEYVVLYDQAASTADAHAAIAAAGGTIVSENTAIGVATVRGGNGDFAERATGQPAIDGVAPNRMIGAVPDVGSQDGVAELEGTLSANGSTAASSSQTGEGAEPLESLQWGLKEIGATLDGAHEVQRGSEEVLVGIIDTGVDGSHPDIAPNFNAELSRNFTTDIPVDANGEEVDGPCEYEGCKDPANVDHNEHGTHVASIIGSPRNGLGVSGIAPEVSLVNLRAGQDSGYFFLQPTLDALTYAGDHGIDVVNMSYYVDPWLYNCRSNPADSPEDQAEQRTTIEAVQRALDYARERGVTLISAAGNQAEDPTKPVTDDSSPNFASEPGEAPYPRRTDPEDCASMPSDGDGVVGVTATGPSGRKSYYSSFGVGLADVAAPGGDAYDNPEQALNFPDTILAAMPQLIAEQNELVDENGNPTVPNVVRGDDGSYYQYLQGTSMASPHATGVAALIISEYGHEDKEHGGLTLDPAEVEKRLLDTATDTPCPESGEFTYTRNVVNPDTEETEVVTDTHVCEGDPGNNGFFGEGVVNADAAVSSGH